MPKESPRQERVSIVIMTELLFRMEAKSEQLAGAITGLVKGLATLWVSAQNPGTAHFPAKNNFPFAND